MDLYLLRVSGLTKSKSRRWLRSGISSSSGGIRLFARQRGDVLTRRGTAQVDDGHRANDDIVSGSGVERPDEVRPSLSIADVLCAPKRRRATAASSKSQDHRMRAPRRRF
jgi:hypothetical protein